MAPGLRHRVGNLTRKRKQQNGPRGLHLSSLCGRIPHPGTRRKLGGGAIGAAYELRLESVVFVGTASLPSLPDLFFERGTSLDRETCAFCAAVGWTPPTLYMNL